MRIAIIGAGISGITAAYLLGKEHEVTLFERNDYLGGHTNTRLVDDLDCGPTAIDTGFIVCNPRNYPNFYNLLDEWSVRRKRSEMSFGFYSELSGLQYKGPGMFEFLQAPGNFLNRRFLGMLLEQNRFNRRVLGDLKSGSITERPLSEYLADLKASDYFVDHYLAPLIASIWSSPDLNALDFPATTFAVFFRNHGMLELRKRPVWYTVEGGSHAYTRAFARQFRGTVRLSTPVAGVSRSEHGVSLRLHDGTAEYFDKVVLASHADETLSLLSDPEVEERELLAHWSYSRNRAVLHTDPAVMPPRRALWAAWNYHLKGGADRSSPVAITYYMNCLQRLGTKIDYFVTLNPPSSLDERSILYDVVYTHPIYSPAAVRSQHSLRQRNGLRHTFFCGAYLGYGFHEDGVKSAIDAVQALKGSR